MFNPDDIVVLGDSQCEPDATVHGGKGAGLIRMANAGFNVPPAIIVPTSLCQHYYLSDISDNDEHFEAAVAAIVNRVIAESKAWGARLFSVRSGAPVSMPGMMDTILNVGLTESTMPYWRGKLGEGVAEDCRRRLIEMLGEVAACVHKSEYETLVKLASSAGKDARAINELRLNRFANKVDFPFYDDLSDQLTESIRAVVRSWGSERAVAYRKMHKIHPSIGTAIVIQTMVFGNRNERSGTGVMFSRNPLTGAHGIYGEFMIGAQGEDIVSGGVTPLPLSKMWDAPIDGGPKSMVWPEVHGKLVVVARRLEQMYRDMVDVEFTVEDGQLFILQSRVGKRSAQAAFKIAHDLHAAGTISDHELFGRLSYEQYVATRRASIAVDCGHEPSAVGTPASPGVAKGRAVHSVEEALAADGDVILVRDETSPDDIKGMARASGIVTRVGGATSHAAVVARAMNKPCVTGLTGFKVGNGKMTVDGGTGRVWLHNLVPVIDPVDTPEIKAITARALALPGAIELVPDVDVNVTGRVMVIASAHHRRSNSGIALIVALEELPTYVRSAIVVDVRDPAQVLSDASLWELLYEDTPARYSESYFVGDLVHHAAALKGIVICGMTYENREKLEAAGYECLAETPLALPREYAMFKVLMKEVH